MAKRRQPTKYTGVFFKMVQRVGGKGEEKAFYAVYKQNGKVIETLVGYEFRNDMTAARAARIRGELIEGKRQTAAEQRRESERNPSLSILWEHYSVERLTNRDTLVTDRGNMKHIPSALAGKKPADFTTRDLEKLKKDLFAKGLSDQTVRHVLGLIRRVIRWGKRQGLCTMPEDLIFDLPRVDNCKTEFLTADQLKALLDALNQDHDQQTAAIVRLALATGIRRSALFALEWGDIDFERGMVTLRGESAKSGRTATIPLSGAAMEILREVRENPFRTNSPLIFPSARTGGQRTTLGKGFSDRIKKAAELPQDFRLLHGLRHTFASLLASSGKVDMYTLQKLMTHESAAMTQRYAHLRDEALRQAAGVVDGIFKIY